MKVRSAVVDTNVLISARLIANSAPARVLAQLRGHGAKLLFSEPTFAELVARLRLPKFRRYASLDEVEAFLKTLADIAELREPDIAVTVCRDPDDNKFLSLAQDGQADCIITGDRDLLVLNPFEGIPILSPSGFLGMTRPDKP